MGRITIFTIDECRFCIKTKAALTNRDIPYTEINIASHPDKRSDMLALADQLTVPQVFFNEKYIGGADDTIALLERWNEEKSYPTALERYQKEIESQPDPTDPRLAPPSTPPIVVNPPPERTDDDKVLLPDGQRISVLDLTEKLLKSLPQENLSYLGLVYKNCLKGLTCVASLMETFGIQEKDEAVKFGQLLQQKKILHHVTNDHEFSDSSYFYRLQPFQTPTILNSYRIWSDRIDQDHMALVTRLAKMMGKITSDATDGDGNVDYIKASENENYPAFEEAVCEIQGVSMINMDDKMKIAFGINLYNLMIKYAFIKVGIPSSNFQRQKFFGKTIFYIGGDEYSFNDLENGILRGNSKAPYALQAPFSSYDPRMKLMVKNVDPRIHFGLNCGAKSCPPVKKFTVVAIEEELRIVASAFAEQDENVLVDEDSNELHLTSILSWFRADFAESKDKLPEAILNFLKGEKKEKLEKMIKNKKKSIKITFMTYDWGTDASKSKMYNIGKLKSKKLSASALFVY